MSQSETTSSFSYLENQSLSDRGSLGMNGQTPSVETLDYEPMTDKIEEGPVLSLNGNGDDVGVAEAIHGPWWKSEYISCITRSSWEARDVSASLCLWWPNSHYRQPYFSRFTNDLSFSGRTTTFPIQFKCQTPTNRMDRF